MQNEKKGKGYVRLSVFLAPNFGGKLTSEVALLHVHFIYDMSLSLPLDNNSFGEPFKNEKLELSLA